MGNTRQFLMACLAVAAFAMPAHAGPAAAATTLSSATWLADDGSALRFSDFGGRPVLVAMAYSSCTRTCPITLKRLHALATQALARGENPVVLIVSYDPVTDTPQVWTKYRREHQLFDQSWHFLNGQVAQTHALARVLGIGDYWRYDEHVMHDFAIGILGPDGRLAGIKRWNES